MSVVAAGLRFLKSARLRPGSLRGSQSNESILVESFANKLSIPKTFCEFGFDITEFNCSRLVRGGMARTSSSTETVSACILRTAC